MHMSDVRRIGPHVRMIKGLAKSSECITLQSEHNMKRYFVCSFGMRANCCVRALAFAFKWVQTNRITYMYCPIVGLPARISRKRIPQFPELVSGFLWHLECVSSSKHSGAMLRCRAHLARMNRRMKMHPRFPYCTDLPLAKQNNSDDKYTAGLLAAFTEQLPICVYANTHRTMKEAT